MDKINIIIRKCSDCDDYTQLKIKGKVVLEGDYYHDKIDERTEGFIDGLIYCEKEVFIGKEEYVCEHCDYEYK